jgi:hypothetical protein
MTKREGWKSVPLEVPDFVHELFERLRDDYGDIHGVAPSQPLTFSALAFVADTKSLEAALKKYRAECKRRGIRHG